ncbi:MAG: copper transporter [Mycobacteriales bacterium]
MIDFRYHLVTIIAIFLALAVGIVVGTTALNGLVVTDLHHNVARLEAEKAKLTSLNDEFVADLSTNTRFARAVEPLLVAGRLAGRDVAVIGLPGSSRAIRASVVALITAAGARIPADIGLTSRFVDPTEQPLLDALSRDFAPPGQNFASGSPLANVADVLAASLAIRGPGRPPAVGTLGAAAAVVSGFVSNGLVTLASPTPGPAPLVVLVAGPPAAAAPPRTDLAGAAAVALARGFAAQAQAVEMVGPAAAAQTGGALADLRADPAAASVTTSVDGIDTPQGQVAAVFGLLDAASGRGTGAYGSVAGDTATPVLTPPTPSLPAR